MVLLGDKHNMYRSNDSDNLQNRLNGENYVKSCKNEKVNCYFAYFDFGGSNNRPLVEIKSP